MISAVVLTKNEEKNIKKCLDSLKWCDEIVVVDDFSQDRTIEIASSIGRSASGRKKPKIKVHVHKMKDFANQRNFGLEKANGDWVLFVDADERISAALAAQIKNEKVKMKNGNVKLKSRKIIGYYIRRKDYIFRKWLRYGEAGKIKLLRLAKKNAGKWQGAVHETWEVGGMTAEFKNHLLHYPHPTVKDFLRKIDEYSTIRARELYSQGIKTNFFEIVAYPIGKFLKNFVWYFGFLDGLSGFLHAIMMSFHSFLVRGKLWLMYYRGDKT